MGEWKTVKLAEVLRYRKGNILINNDEEYSLCRVQLHRRGVVLREKKMGSQIKTKKQQVCRAGDLVVAEMDAKFGGYGFIPNYLDGAIVSSHYYLYELDKSKITQEYFEILIKTDFIQNQIEAKGSTNYSSIRAWEFLDYEIPLQSIALQNSIAAKYLKHSRFKDDLGIELNAQLKYLSQLRQAVLQEAIEGKLTAEWRKKNPKLICGDNHASKLLEKIKAEKERLIKERNTSTKLSARIMKDKPLALITDAEKPFDLPEGWIWCRLGEVAQGFEYGSSAKSIKAGKVPVLRMGNLQNGVIVWENLVYTNDDGEIQQYLLKLEDLLFNRTNSRELVGKTALFDCEEKAIYAGYIVRFHMCGKISARFSNCVMNSIYHRKWCDAVKADALGQSNINATKLREFIFPLPSLAEQQAIVERVDKLMAMIEELEKQVSERKEQSEMLMQSVLREAFAKE